MRRAADPSRIERLKKAREARRQRGYTLIEVVIGLALTGLVVYVLVALLSTPFPQSREVRCPPVSSPTGRLLCYSGGILVYQTPTYRNGGILCSSSGVEIKTIPGNSAAFCIEESRQRDVWDPPEPSREAER